MNDDAGKAVRAGFAGAVSGRFGVMPNFFRSAPAAAGLIEELWAFAESAYLDSPLPSLFKERLFVHLSRFCPVRYCVVRHVGFLIGQGRPAGDPEAPPETIEQVVALLARPVPDAAGLDAVLSRLETAETPAPIPAPRTQAEADLFDALTVLFVEPRRSGRARAAVRTAVGEAAFEILTAFLAFVRTAHYWTETHPDLAYEPDMAAVMARHPDLARLLLDPSEAERVGEGDRLRRALDALQRSDERLRGSQETLRRNDVWLAAQNEAFQAAMNGAPLKDSLGVLIGAAIGLSGDERRCAFYIADADGRRLRHVVGMSEAYARCVDGFQVSPESLACGLAVATGEPVITPDVLAEPWWWPWVWLARDYDYRGCWSFPVETAPGRLVGSLAMYFREPREPTPRDRDLAAALTQTAAVVISRHQENEDRARAETALRDSEARRRDVLNAMAEGFALFAPDFTILDVNDETVRLDGRPRDELIGRSHWDAFPETERSPLGDFYRRVMRERAPGSLEHRYRWPDGRVMWVDVRAYPTPDGGVAVFWRDSTERKRAEERLRESERKYRTLFESIDEGFVTAEVIYDPEGRPVDALYLEGNPAASRLTEGRTYDHRLFSEHLPGAEGYWLEVYDRVARTGVAERAEWYLRLLDRWYDFHVSRVASLDGQSESRRVAIVFQDITQRKRAEAGLRESEERFRAAFEQANVGIVQASLDARILLPNPGFCRIVGYDAEEAKTLTVRDITHPDDYDLDMAQAARVLAGEIGGYTIEKRYVRKDGTVVWVEMASSLVRDAAGEPSYALAVVQDISARKPRGTCGRRTSGSAWPRRRRTASYTNGAREPARRREARVSGACWAIRRAKSPRPPRHGSI